MDIYKMLPGIAEHYKDKVSEDQLRKALNVLEAQVSEYFPMCREKGLSIQKDDLYMGGFEGLVETIPKYEPSLGSLENYTREAMRTGIFRAIRNGAAWDKEEGKIREEVSLEEVKILLGDDVC